MAIATAYPVSHSGGALYTNPANIYTDDGNATTIMPTAQMTYYTLYVVFNAFTDLDIPVGSIINSVNVRTQFRQDSYAGMISVYVRARHNAVNLGSAATNAAYPTAYTLLTCSTTGTWTEAMLKDGLAGGYVNVLRYNPSQSNTVYFDYMSLIVDYTPPAGPIEGSSSQNIVITTQSSGFAIKSGSLTPIIVVTTQSSGIAIKSGSLTTAVIVTTQSGGLAIKSGSSGPIIVISPEGLGTKNEGIIEGSSSQNIIVSTQGKGLALKSGISEVAVLITTEGSGRDVGGIPEGSSTSSFIVAVAGLGRKISTGNSYSTEIVIATSLGRKIAVGNSNSTVIITAVGSGSHQAASKLSAKLAVERRNTEIETLVRKTTIQGTLRNIDLEITGYKNTISVEVREAKIEVIE